MIVEEYQNYDDYKYAGFWIRFLAYFIDGIILSVAFSILSYATGSNIQSYNSISSPGSFLGLILTIAYFVYFETSDKQATIGKFIFDMKVVKEDGSKLTAKDSAIRYFSKILSAIILFIGFIMAGFDDKKQALHDKIAHTYVVRK